MANLDIKLHDKQQEIFLSKARFKVCAAGRRAGKSYLSAVLLLIEALKEENEFGIDLKNKETWYVAPTFAQAKDIMWNLLKDVGEDFIEQALENTATLRLINGRTIKLKGSDRPDTLRGRSLAYVVLDEYASMKPEVWDLIISPALADTKGSALFIGTPDSKNHFYDLWLQAAKTDEWEQFHFNSLDNPIIDPKELEQARSRMSKEAFRQEFEASFQAGGGVAFKEKDWLYAKTSPEAGTIYITVDPAGFGDGKGMVKSAINRLDETAIAVVEVSPSGWFIHDVIHGRWDVRETSLQIIKAAKKYQPAALGIEGGSLKNAIMPYLEDQMRRLGIYPHVVPLTHGGEKKPARITWSLQGRFENGRIFFKEGADYIKPLSDQLLDFPNKMTHDDLIDALAYIDQISSAIYAIGDYEDEYKPLDILSGY